MNRKEVKIRIVVLLFVGMRKVDVLVELFG